MANEIKFVLSADSREGVAHIQKMTQAFEDLNRKQEEGGKSSTKYSQALGVVKTALATIGIALTAQQVVAFGKDTVQAAISFESAFAGVRKTVNATEEEFAGLRNEFIGMSKEIPITANEFARIGEAAGQLGIRTENITSFSRVMADLGVATNLSSDQAATALARLANITQMSQKDFDRLGSTIVALGNNFATTEAEIVDMAMRIAGAGKQMGMSEAEVLSFAAALSSVGIESQAGGTAISRVFVEIDKAVQLGGKNLGLFADTAQMSIAEFKKLFQEDAALAATAFIEGLGQLEARGKSVTVVLDDMGLDAVRVADALKRASGAGDLLRGSLSLGNRAWEENNALLNEAEQRYKTTESQLQIFRNQVTALQIEMGENALPVLIDYIGGLRLMGSWITDEVIPAYKALEERFANSFHVLYALFGLTDKTVTVQGGLYDELAKSVAILDDYGVTLRQGPNESLEDYVDRAQRAARAAETFGGAARTKEKVALQFAAAVAKVGESAQTGGAFLVESMQLASGAITRTGAATTDLRRLTEEEYVKIEKAIDKAREIRNLEVEVIWDTIDAARAHARENRQAVTDIAMDRASSYSDMEHRNAVFTTNFLESLELQKQASAEANAQEAIENVRKNAAVSASNDAFRLHQQNENLKHLNAVTQAQQREYDSLFKSVAKRSSDMWSEMIGQSESSALTIGNFFSNAFNTAASTILGTLTSHLISPFVSIFNQAIDSLAGSLADALIKPATNWLVGMIPGMGGQGGIGGLMPNPLSMAIGGLSGAGGAASGGILPNVGFLGPSGGSAAGAGAASGGGFMSSLGGFFTNPWTIAAGIGAAAFFGLRKIGEGRRTANEWVNEVEDPFWRRFIDLTQGERILQSQDLGEISSAGVMLRQLNDWYLGQATDFARNGSIEKKVIDQSLGNTQPHFERLIQGMRSQVYNLGGVPSFHEGGISKEEGLALVDKGELHIPEKDWKGMLGRGGGQSVNLTINVQALDASDFNRVVQKKIVPVIERMLNNNTMGARERFRP